MGVLRYKRDILNFLGVVFDVIPMLVHWQRFGATGEVLEADMTEVPDDRQLVVSCVTLSGSKHFTEASRRRKVLRDFPPSPTDIVVPFDKY